MSAKTTIKGCNLLLEMADWTVTLQWLLSWMGTKETARWALLPTAGITIVDTVSHWFTSTQSKWTNFYRMLLLASDMLALIMCKVMSCSIRFSGVILDWSDLFLKLIILTTLSRMNGTSYGVVVLVNNIFTKAWMSIKKLTTSPVLSKLQGRINWQ